MEKRRFRITEISKKIICMAIVLVMLAGNFVSPVMSIAAELNNSKNAANTTTAEENANNEKIDEGEKESANKANEEANNESDNQAKIDEIEAAFDAAKEKENNGDAKATENAEGNQTQTNNTKNLKSAAPVLRAANTPQSNRIEDRLTPDIKSNVTVKTSNDSYQIVKFQTEFISGATKDENNNLVWTPTSTASGHEFVFRVNYALSGLKEHPSEAFKITIPKSILRDREGNLADRFEMSLPTNTEYDGTTELAYIENEDYIIVYNPDEVEAGINGYFEVAYATKTSTVNYRDYDKTKTNTIPNGGTASDPFNAVISVKTNVNDNEDILANVSDDKNVFIDTNAKIQSTQKRYPTIYRNWNSSWMQTTPEDANDYYYLVWEISSYIDNATQKYNFTLQDFVTNLTDGTAEEDYELVGYKLAGERYYSNNNTQANQISNGYRYDYVLTRHKKSTFAGRTYKLKNTVTATVDPIDQVDADTKATSSNIFNWNPAFVPPTGHFDIRKFGNNSGFGGRYANYDLDKLQNEEVDLLKNFKYLTETVGYAYPWTLREGGSSDNYQDYGVNNVNYDTWDDTLYLEDDETPMNTEDYYLEYFTYNISNQDVDFDDFFNRFNTKSATYESDEIITFYAKFGDRSEQSGNEWVQIGTYNLNTKELTPNTDYVDVMTTSKITFKDDVHATGWRYTTSNKHYYTNITVTPYFVLTNSDYVKSKLKDENNEFKSSIKIQNDVSTKITDYRDTTIFEKTVSAFDYARVTYYDSYISKTVASVANKKAKKQYIITWKVNAWETATSGEGVAEYITQDSGKFYDLIPLGGEIDVKTIQVQTEKGFLPENEYSYELKHNYNESGRTMLVVTINEPADYFNVYYTTVHPWESMKDYGKEVLNPVAYETGNEKITKGSPDNGGNLSTLNKVLMTNLDKTTNDNKFLYSERTYNINALTAAVAGLSKKVKNSTDEDYIYSTEVEPNEAYTYKLRFENTYLNSAKNLVFFDNIESFKIVNSETGTETTSGWHGTLKSIDLAQLNQKGIDAKVYVSTIENLDLENNKDLTNTSVWNLAIDGTNLSTAKAIAIDMTKTTAGEDFILHTGDSVTAILYMQAPDGTSEEIEQNQYTYNNIYMQNTLIDDLNQTKDYFIHQDYTAVKYHVVADVPMRKVNAKDENEGIKGITFRLKGTSIYGNEVDENITSPSDGNITFKSMEAGEYILQEYEGTPDWIEDHTEHVVKINMDKTVYIDDQLVTKETPFIITNEPRAHTDVTIYKKDLVKKNKAVEGAKFKLSGTSDYGNEILMYGISDASGKVTFSDIEKGTYDLIEISTGKGYTLNEYNKEVFRVVVDENSNYDVLKLINETAGYESIYNNGIYEIYNEPLHNLSFTKKDLIDRNVVVQGVTFKVTGTSDYGTYYEKIATSDQEGKVAFDGLEKGTYILTEIDTPDDYVLNTDTYTVTIDKMNNFTISGSHMDTTENGTYNIYNEPKHDFYFTKKDKYNNQNLGGATFKLYGISNIGNTYDDTATSIAGTGIVTFDNLESGTYLIREIESPYADEVTYVLDEKERIVEVFEDGKVTLDNEVIWPLSERNENDPYIWYNTRNKGQITITKKWVDNLTNEQRQEPKIYISTIRGESAYSKAYFRTADSIHSIIDYVTRENVTTFKRNITLSEQEVLAKAGVTRLDNDYENSNAQYKIYAWLENGTVYWWTKADRAVLPANLDYYFQNETGLTDINWSTIYRNGFWTGTSGSEAIQASVTNMQNMFYGCTSMVNLDISIINNSEITEETKENMKYAFGKNIETPEGAMRELKFITIGDNFKLFDTSILPKGKWKIQTTNEEIQNTSLIGNVLAGTYEKEVVSLQVGDTIRYTPSTVNTYIWDQTLATSNAASNAEPLELKSGANQTYNISEWYVLSIDGDNITMVPKNPCGSLTLQGAQGYNNAVKLLNDACSTLYSDSSKGITARSINIEDIENVITTYGDASILTTVKESYGYNIQKDNKYSSSYSKYPEIYARENKSVINDEENTNGIGLSEQIKNAQDLTQFISRTAANNNNGSITTATSIRPYQTYYYLSNGNLVTALGGNNSIYRKVLLNNSTPSYWVASRCVALYSSNCDFDVSCVNSGYLIAYNVCGSVGYNNSFTRGLFPVVSLSSDVLTTTDTNGVYQVE